MPSPSDVTVVLTWPSKGSVAGYITTLRGIGTFDTFNFDLNTLSVSVVLLDGFKYHQETYYINDSGTHHLKSLDFIAGQPLPAPTNLQVMILDDGCLPSSASLQLYYSDFLANPDYNPNLDVQINGTYVLPHVAHNVWRIEDVLVYTNPDDGYQLITTLAVVCGGGIYNVGGALISDIGTDTMALGETKHSIDPNPNASALMGGAMTLSIAS